MFCRGSLRHSINLLTASLSHIPFNRRTLEGSEPKRAVMSSSRSIKEKVKEFLAQPMGKKIKNYDAKKLIANFIQKRLEGDDVSKCIQLVIFED